MHSRSFQTVRGLALRGIVMSVQIHPRGARDPADLADHLLLRLHSKVQTAGTLRRESTFDGLQITPVRQDAHTEWHTFTLERSAVPGGKFDASTDQHFVDLDLSLVSVCSHPGAELRTARYEGCRHF